MAEQKFVSPRVTMRGFTLYTVLLCLIVLVAMTVFFTVLITIIYRQQLKLIVSGQQDEKIKKDKLELATKKGCKIGVIIDRTISLLLLVILSVLLIFGVLIGVSTDKKVGNIPSLKVVSSTSMSNKYEGNTYLKENNLNDQMQVFDLICVYKLPKEEDIRLYDVIVYQNAEGVMIIHRIVGIEEPNEKHPDERWYQFKGDASSSYDKFPVRYSQMIGIYRGDRIPNVGSFVFFMQSPAGWICFLLIILVIIATPIVEKKLKTAVDDRYAIIQQIAETEERC